MKKLSFAAAGILILLCVMPVINSKAAQTYDVTFRGGSHGELSTDGASWSNKIVKEAAAGGEFPGIPPDVRSNDENYIFTGWNKEIDLDSPVIENQTYVAQFSLVTDGQEYAVKYVTRDGTEVATPKIAVGEIGTTVEGYAENIAGYTLDQKKKTLVLTKDSTEIRFIYTPVETNAPQTNAPQTNAPQTNAPQTNPPQTNAPQTNAPSTNAAQSNASNNTNASSQNTAADRADQNQNSLESSDGQEQNKVTIPDENPPLAKEPETIPETEYEEEMFSESQTIKIDDEEVALAKEPQSQSGNWGWAACAGAVALLAGGTGIGVFIKKRRDSR